MWDFYFGRQWICKYVPRYGKVVEAGCGFGRYVFYFKRFGIDIEGVDFSEYLIERLNSEKIEIVPDSKFIYCDITKLPYDDNSISGYLSLGVVEHFIEGPEKAIAEAYRVLRPGGIAIITVPNVSFFILYRKIVRTLKNVVLRILGRKIVSPKYFQYEYSPRKSKKYLHVQGFCVSRAEGCDLLCPFSEIGKFDKNKMRKYKFGYWFANTFERIWIKNFGGQSITIALKKAPLIYCFLSGELSANEDSQEKYDFPISEKLQKTKLAQYFLKNRKVNYSEAYEIDPPLLLPTEKNVITVANHI